MTIDPTALLAMIMIFLGSFVQTAIGFGLAIVSAPILIIIAPQYVPAPICLVALFISLLNSLKHRNSIELGGLKMDVFQDLLQVQRYSFLFQHKAYHYG